MMKERETLWQPCVYQKSYELQAQGHWTQLSDESDSQVSLSTKAAGCGDDRDSEDERPNKK